MGAGKSSIGLGVARKLNLAFVDTDDLIHKKEKMSINDIFKKYGESKFRLLEKECLHSLTFGGASSAIVSTGGGTPVFFDNMEFMNTHGKTIWLDTPLDEIILRLKNMKDDRPLINSLADHQVTSHLKQMYQSRLPYYQKAHFKVDNVGYDDDIIDRIVQIIKQEL